MKADPLQAVEDFVERLGLIAQADGLPRTAGRIMGLLVIHGGPVSAAELAERLAVSRGSISTNTRLLENLGVIERVSRHGSRQDGFRIGSAPYVELLKGSLGRLRKARDAVAEAQCALPGDWVDARRRLGELGAFYAGLIRHTEEMIEPGRTRSTQG